MPRFFWWMTPALLLLAACSVERGLHVRDDPSLRAFAGDALSPRSRGAWKRLMRAEYFGGTLNPWTWGSMDRATDACTLWMRGERLALLDVALHATWEGRLWAMSALRHMDPGAFESLTPDFQGDAEISAVHGCIGSTASVSQAFAADVLGERHLGWTYARLTTPPDANELLEWGRSRGRRPGITAGPAREAFELLDACAQIDTGGILARAFDTLIEEEPSCYAAAFVLLNSERAAVRYWGARVLRETAPGSYRVLRARWVNADAEFACLESEGLRRHTLNEALTAHVD